MAEQKVRTERCEFLQIYNEGGAVYLTVGSSYQQTVTFDHNLTLNITFSLFYFFLSTYTLQWKKHKTIP